MKNTIPSGELVPVAQVWGTAPGGSNSVQNDDSLLWTGRRPYKYAIPPRSRFDAIGQNEHFEPREKLVLLIVDAFDSTAAGCFASNKTLSEHIGVSESGIRKTMGTLRKKVAIHDVRDGQKFGRRVNSLALDIGCGKWKNMRRSSTAAIKTICEEPRISYNQKLLLFLMYLASLSSPNSESRLLGCAYTNKELASRLGRTKRSIDGDLRRLLRARWYSEVKFNGKTSYRVVTVDEGEPIKIDRSKLKKM